ncbi:hypothetical protein [Streptomyces werraensis]|uniref:hypothetical protein n=1 Tax=Streptomyces werraensis TaxID=68284 RepID=UPI001CE2F705
MTALPWADRNEAAPDGPEDFYAAHLTLADEAEVRAFLTARCSEVYARYRPDAPEARMARAFHEAAGGEVDMLHDALCGTGTEAMTARLNHWNSLMHILEPWRGTPGHNGDRWKLIAHTDEWDRARTQARAQGAR